jgi:acyl dehydratase
MSRHLRDRSIDHVLLERGEVANSWRTERWDSLRLLTPGLIVQGGVTTGLLNAVVAEDLPGPGTVFLETNWRFVKAVRVGETITASVCVEDVREDRPICKLETVVRNANGEVCVTGTATTYTVPLLDPGGRSP